MIRHALNRDQYLELEKIGLGAFAPLDGFMDEKTFRMMINDDAMGTEKLAEGIRAFTADAGKLKQIIVGLR